MTAERHDSTPLSESAPASDAVPESPSGSAGQEADHREIAAIVARQFASLCWRPGGGPDAAAFARDFHPDATVWPAARPAAPLTVAAFLTRMSGLSATTLRSFHETVLGTEIRVFGDVAVAIAAGLMTENGAAGGRAVEMLLLVKSAGAWRIVAQAWDRERASAPIPDALLRAGGDAQWPPRTNSS